MGRRVEYGGCKIDYELGEVTNLPRLLVQGRKKDVKELERNLREETSITFF